VLGGLLCGGMGVDGWLVMALFWGAFLSLATWAVTRMFPPFGRSQGSGDVQDILDRRLADGELDLEAYRRMRTELAAVVRR
jgi:putative membrane protein